VAKCEAEIRIVGAGDTALFARIADDVFDEPVQAARLAAYLAAPDHHLVVAIHDAVIVGQLAAVIHRHPDQATELYIDNLGVAPTFQRRGVARRLLDTMLALGRERGCEKAWVGTELDNVPARRLYEAGGASSETFIFYEWGL
jgi:ribosomal protein S18 acetylase RimI-like enzyme